MPKRAPSLSWIPSIVVRRGPEAADAPLHRQIREALRHAILRGELNPGERLPSSRALAAGLGVSRHTVEAAYDALAAEGYISGRVGSGTRVLMARPHTYLRHLAAPHFAAYHGDFRRLLRDARFPAQIVCFRDSEGNALRAFR